MNFKQHFLAKNRCVYHVVCLQIAQKQLARTFEYSKGVMRRADNIMTNRKKTTLYTEGVTRNRK
jgi:hypothetical protein